MNGIYQNSLEHLMAELERIDVRLRLQIKRVRLQAEQPTDDQFRGLYISEEEIDTLVAGSPVAQADASGSDLSNSPEAIDLLRLEEEIAEKKAASLASGMNLPLCELATNFGLSDFEVDTLLICLLPEIDTRYERLYAYLHDDVTRKNPSVNLVLHCRLDGLEKRMSAREAFLPTAPLVAHHFLRLEEDTPSRAQSLLTKSLKIDDRIVNHLLGSGEIDSRLAGHTQIIIPSIGLDSLVLTEQLSRQLVEYTSRLNHSTNTVLHMKGPLGAGKKMAAEALCHSCGLPLLMVDVPGLLADSLAPETGIALVIREAKLQKAAICWSGFDHLISEDATKRIWLQRLIRALGDFSLPIFATGEADWHPGNALEGKVFTRIELDNPPYDVRRRLWGIYLNGHHDQDVSETDVEEVADKFRFTPAQIRDAAATARNMSIVRGDGHVSMSDLHAACRIMSNQRLNLLARKIQPRYEWDDIILPKDQKAQLREIANYVKYRHVVFADWNFEQKVSLGKGLNVLFAGPSGTGKTMASEIIANELGLDLYKIDLSTVISKYIGETEKNLDKIFTEAQNSNSILFFDEADAVFGKRSEVRDSHDRYANIEVAYLLQKMEEYDGIVILATNLRKNLDEAFSRRMHFSLEFPLPEEPDRLLIWQGVFPAEAPLERDIDLNFMARQFKMTGGNIRNIALSAAFLAASDGHVIKMEHMIRATKREYQKVGRLWNEADFGPYFELVKG